ncbi:MAG: undecaprenyl-diphosphate phosphatase, partial [Blautia sp.]|nr:undecaprenyl-diphosphate phosphatase [Blautia sp.]
VITFLLLLSSAITALLGYLARNLVAKAVSSPLLLGAFFLVTGLFLLVTDLSRVGGRKSAKEAGPETGIWLGIAQGVASFPGISRFGLTFCAGLMCGLSRRFMAKFSCMMSVPASIGASFLIWDAWSDPALTADAAQGIVMAAFVAFICGLFLCKTIVKLFAKAPLVAFALYDMAFGGVILLRAFR